MHSRSRLGKRWRRFNRKYGSAFLIGFMLLCILGLVGLLMWVMNIPVHSGP